MSFDAQKAIQNYLADNKITEMDQSQQIIAVAKLVAGIPWGEGRSIEEVLKTKKVGTCTGKHMVLEACFKELGIDCRPVVCTFRWGDQAIKFPVKLRSILEEGEWEHGHNFLQARKENGKFIDVDVTWNPALRSYGFKTFPANWDGKSSFVGVDDMMRRWDGVNMEVMKKYLVNALNPELKSRRERFLEEFTKWVNSINK